MLSGLTHLAVGLGLGLGLSPAADGPGGEPASAPAASASTGSPSAPKSASKSAPKSTTKSAPKGASKVPDVAPDQALEVVLECGLRLLVARDRTLPVASVVLAVESGPEDDPEEYPGLVHALAYYLLQGNRELRPGESIDTVHAGGGVASMAIGLSQVRYESIIPASRLQEVLWIESQRLRFPSIRETIWKKTIGWAAGDSRRPGILPPAALAAVHRTPGLGHDSRRPGSSMASLNDGALASQLRTRFNYARATLVVVAPNEPREVLAMVEPLFADLPGTQRKVMRRLPGARALTAESQVGPAVVDPPAEDPAAVGGTPGVSDVASPADAAAPGSTADEGGEGPGEAASAAPATGDPAEPGVAGADATSPDPAETPAEPAIVEPDPEVVPVGPHKLPIYAWSVPGDPASNAWATAFCRTLNRQRRGRGEPKSLRVSCAIDSDPRRSAMLIQVAGAEEPLVTLRERIARLVSGRDRGLLRAQAKSLASELRFVAHRPLGLARQLAITADDDVGQTPVARPIEELTGITPLDDVASLEEVFPALLHLGEAVVLVRPEPQGKGKKIRSDEGQGSGKKIPGEGSGA